VLPSTASRTPGYLTAFTSLPAPLVSSREKENIFLMIDMGMMTSSNVLILQ
jgi:hypothetical protein